MAFLVGFCLLRWHRYRLELARKYRAVVVVVIVRDGEGEVSVL